MKVFQFAEVLPKRWFNLMSLSYLPDYLPSPLDLQTKELISPEKLLTLSYPPLLEQEMSTEEWIPIL